MKTPVIEQPGSELQERNGMNCFWFESCSPAVSIFGMWAQFEFQHWLILGDFIVFQDMVRALEQLVALRTELQESNSTCEQQVSHH